MDEQKPTIPYLSITEDQLQAIKEALVYAVGDYTQNKPDELHFNELLVKLIQALSVPHLTTRVPGDKDAKATTEIPLVSQSNGATFVGKIDTKGLYQSTLQLPRQAFEGATTHVATVHYASFPVKETKPPKEQRLTEKRGHIGFSVCWTPSCLLQVGKVFRAWLRNECVDPVILNTWQKAEVKRCAGQVTTTTFHADQIARWLMLRLIELCPTPKPDPLPDISRFINGLLGNPNDQSAVHTLGEFAQLLSAVHFLPMSPAHTNDEPLPEGAIARLSVAKRTSTSDDAHLSASMPSPSELCPIDSTYSFMVVAQQFNNLRTNIYALRVPKPRLFALAPPHQQLQSSKGVTEVLNYAIGIITAPDFSRAKNRLDSMIGVVTEVSQDQHLNVTYTPLAEGTDGSRIASLMISLTEPASGDPKPIPLTTHTASVRARFSPATFGALQDTLDSVLKSALGT